MKIVFSLLWICIITTTYAQGQKYPHRYTLSLKTGYSELLKPSNFSNQVIVKKLRSLNNYGTILSIEFNPESSEIEERKWLSQNPSIANYQPVVSLNKREGCNPNDSYYLSQYDMELMKFDEAWCYNNSGLSPQGDTLVVGVIDFGFLFRYKDLLPNIYINFHEIPDNGIDDDNNGYIDDYYGWNPRYNGDSFEIEKHGTEVISVIGAKGNNKMDISGTNQNIKMLLCSSDNTDDLVACYYYFVEMKRRYLNTAGKEGAFIVSDNLSSGNTGFPDDFPLVCQAYDSLGNVGILTSVATINDNADIDIVGDIPGTCPSDYLIVVTSTDRYDQKAEAGYSIKSVDIGACGERVPMIDDQGKVISDDSGTSFASPHVAGAVSLLYQYCPMITALNISNPPLAVRILKKIILDSGDNLQSLKGLTLTGKRLNMIKALKGLNDYCNADTISPAFNFILKNNGKNEAIEVIFNPEAFGNYNVFVYNSLGQLVDNKTIRFVPGDSGHFFLDIYPWISGVYHIVVEGQGFRGVKSLIKI